jgi:hypothetical protein
MEVEVEVETVGHALWSCLAVQDVWLECNVSIQKSCSVEEGFTTIMLKLCDRLEMTDWELVVDIA